VARRETVGEDCVTPAHRQRDATRVCLVLLTRPPMRGSLMPSRPSSTRPASWCRNAGSCAVVRATLVASQAGALSALRKASARPGTVSDHITDQRTFAQ